MRRFRNLALAALAALSMLAVPEYMDAQTRSGSSSTQTRGSSSSSSVRRSSGSSSSQVRSGSSSSQVRSGSSSSQVRSGSSSSQVRSGSSSSQVRSGSSSSQVRSSSSSNQVRSSSGSNQARSGSSSSQVRSGSSSSQVRSGSSSSQVRSGSSSSQVRSGSSSSQVRSGSSSSQVRSSSGSSAVRSSSNTGSSSSQVRRGTSGTANRVAQPVRGNASVSGNGQVRSTGSASQTRRNTNVTKGGLTTVTSQMREQPNPVRGSSSQLRGAGMHDDFRIDNHSVQRIHPCDRDFIHHDRLGHFYGHHSHYFGYRVQVLPPRYERYTYFGVNYYVCNDVYYRPFRGHYVVCRPPFGVVVNAALADLAFSAVRFSYYNNVYNTYRAIDENNRYIDQQNRIIAQNNATIMAQNQAIAMNPGLARSSHQIADRLGLVQSYAYADRQYYYEDGVFYIINENGRYQTIVPPAGALVQELPEDYDTLVLDGVEYYRVDDTVYRLTLVEGAPYLEVLGQMYGNMARKYNSYYE
ncbi:MAG: DUF6515 family protein [Candidatus Cryptobacteroides sp.]